MRSRCRRFRGRALAPSRAGLPATSARRRASSRSSGIRSPTVATIPAAPWHHCSVRSSGRRAAGGQLATRRRQTRASRRSGGSTRSRKLSVGEEAAKRMHVAGEAVRGPDVLGRPCRRASASRGRCSSSHSASSTAALSSASASKPASPSGEDRAGRARHQLPRLVAHVLRGSALAGDPPRPVHAERAARRAARRISPINADRARQSEVGLDSVALHRLGSERLQVERRAEPAAAPRSSRPRRGRASSVRSVDRSSAIVARVVRPAAVVERRPRRRRRSRRSAPRRTARPTALGQRLVREPRS